MEGRLAWTTFLARTTRSGLVAGSGCDKRQLGMIAKSMDSRAGVCVPLGFFEHVCTSVSSSVGGNAGVGGRIECDSAYE